MRRDPPWAAIEVFATGVGDVLALGLWRLAIAVVYWVWP